ncbi:MAG TPA: hypothetical protein VNT27_04485, partial [Propionibacteriaceae bacterium]|nr:hypothetical protein [Propionibacteriaceae bacterium]
LGRYIVAHLEQLRVVIPTRADHHALDALDALAQSRRPMDMMSQGWSVRRFQASQQWSTMSR